MREYIEQVRGWDEGLEEERFRQNFDPATTRVILSDNRVIGFLGVRPENDVLYIAQAYIIPEYQGQGIGTALIREVLAGDLPVELYVMKLNTGARRLLNVWASESRANTRPTLCAPSQGNAQGPKGAGPMQKWEQGANFEQFRF